MYAPEHERGYLPRIMVWCALPRHEPTTNECERRHWESRVSIISPTGIGLPYGRCARFLLAWLTAEALRQERHELQLDASFDKFMDKLGVAGRSSGPCDERAAIRDQLRRLLSTSFSVTTEETGYWNDHGHRVAEFTDLWWHSKASNFQATLPSRIVLSTRFFEHLIERPIPIDLRVLRRLRSPFAIDVYAWLSYMTRSIGTKTVVSWSDLETQFAHGDDCRSDFRRRLIHFVETVMRWSPLEAYPTRRGLEIHSRLPH